MAATKVKISEEIRQYMAVLDDEKMKEVGLFLSSNEVLFPPGGRYKSPIVALKYEADGKSIGTHVISSFDWFDKDEVNKPIFICQEMKIKLCSEESSSSARPLVNVKMDLAEEYFATAVSGITASRTSSQANAVKHVMISIFNTTQEILMRVVDKATYLQFTPLMGTLGMEISLLKPEL